jgi:hypothetical protein
VQTFVDRGVSRGQRGGSPTVVNLNFLDRQEHRHQLLYLASSMVMMNIGLHVGVVLAVL